MKLSAIAVGDLGADLREEARIIAKAGTIAVRTAANGARRDLETQIRRGFKTRRSARRGQFSGLVRVKVDPVRGYDLTAWARTYSRALYKPTHGGRKQEIDLLDVFDNDTEITANGDRWLAVPTRDTPTVASRGNSERKARPYDLGSKLQGLKTQFIRLGATKALIVGGRAGGRRVVLWVLVKRVRLTRKLTVDAIHQKRSARLEERMARELAKEDARLERKRAR